MALTRILPGTGSEGSKVARMASLSTARFLRAACIAGGILAAAAAFAAIGNAPLISENAGSTAPGVASQSGTVIPAAAKQQSAARPMWRELTPDQQQALAPLANEWDKLDSQRKKKWLAISKKFSSMSPEEQQRVQERMRDWVKLTPDQRRLARESYARAKKLNPDQKSAQWQQYQQLPEEQKKALAARAAEKKKVATLPTAAQRKAKTVPPIKSTPKPVLEQSVTPKAANHSALKPVAPMAPEPSK